MAEIITDKVILHELEPVAEELLSAHLSSAVEWFPHEYVPYSVGRNFPRDYVWTPEDATIEITDPGVRSALVVNLLTEDNLPYYYETISQKTSKDSVHSEWGKRWTAEEGRHSIVLRDFLTVTRLVDPIQLERDRIAQVSLGEVPQPESAADLIAYVVLQELATRVAHWNTGKILGDKTGYELMKRVAIDENLHHLYYLGLLKAGLEQFPDTMLPALERQVRSFEMPGTGIRDFKAHEELIALSGIYGITETQDKVMKPVIIGQLKLDKLDNLSPEADMSRSRIIRRLSALGRLSIAEQEAREQYQENLKQAS